MIDYTGRYATEKTQGINLVRDALRKYGGKTCLDVGCGILERPAYMIKEIEWVGIDPQQGGERKFEFILAEAENLPFDANVFDSALFATSIDHVKSPERVIKEARRVVRTGGHIIVWLTLRPRDKYYLWKRKGGWYNKLHPHAFIESALLKLIPCKFVEKININWGINIFVFRCTE